MHILVVTQQWAPEAGIPQRRMRWLTRGLVTAGHSVDVVTPPPHYPDGHLLSSEPQHQAGAVALGSEGEQIWRTRFRHHDVSLASRILDQAVVGSSSLRVARRAATRHTPDLIVASAPPLPSIAVAWRMARIFDVPFVVDLRDTWPDLVPFISVSGTELAPPSLKRRVLGNGLRFSGSVLEKMLGSADGIITTTSSFAAELTRRWAVPTHTLSNLHVVGRAVPLEDPPPLVRDHLEVLYAGTIGRAQGLHSALDAVELSVDKGVPVHLTLQGTGAHVTAIKKAAADRHLPVDIYGRIDHQHLRERYADADSLLVHLQNWAPLEMSVPSKLYETMASGRHVTLAANGESAAILSDSGAGHCVPAMDAPALADLWEKLQTDRSMLDVGMQGPEWIARQPTAEEDIHGTIDFLRGIA